MIPFVISIYTYLFFIFIVFQSKLFYLSHEACDCQFYGVLREKMFFFTTIIGELRVLKLIGVKIDLINDRISLDKTAVTSSKAFKTKHALPKICENFSFYGH